MLKLHWIYSLIASFAESSNFYSVLGVNLGKKKTYMVSIFSTVKENIVSWSSVGFKEGLNTVLDRDKFLIRAWTYNPNTSLMFVLSIPVAVYLTRWQIIVL